MCGHEHQGHSLTFTLTSLILSVTLTFSHSRGGIIGGVFHPSRRLVAETPSQKCVVTGSEMCCWLEGKKKFLGDRLALKAGIAAASTFSAVLGKSRRIAPIFVLRGSV